MIDTELKLLIRELSEYPLIEPVGQRQLTMHQKRVNDLIEAARYVDRLIKGVN